MCDSGQYWQNSAWGDAFYHQYLDQHANMMRWFQQLHNPTTSPPYNCISHQPSHCHHRNHPTAQSWENTPRYPVASRQNNKHHETFSERYIEDEDYMEDEDLEEEELSSDDELVFNIEALMALKAARDNAPKDEEDSFELIEPPSEEEFDYVELNAYGQLDRKHGRMSQPNTKREVEKEKEIKTYLYGESADTIAGLETSMAISFERLCDIHQPHLWPVLPLLL